MMKDMKFLSLLTLALSVTAWAERPACTMRGILEANRNLFPSDSRALALPGDGGIINPFMRAPSSTEITTAILRARAEALIEVPARSSDATLAIAEETRSFMIKMIPHVEQRALIVKRLESATILLEDCYNTEASFTRGTFHIKLCANAAKTPKLALVMTVAHELGHAIDSCHLPSRLYNKIDPLMVNETDFGDTAHVRVQYFLDTDIRRNERQSRILSSIERSGAVHVVDQGIPRSQSLIHGALQCLSTIHQSYPAPLPDESQDCGGSHSEVSAQVWAAKVIVEYLRAHPPQSPQELISLFANSLPSYKHPKPTGKELDMDLLVLSNPFTQAQYGCEPQPVRSCL